MVPTLHRVFLTRRRRAGGLSLLAALGLATAYAAISLVSANELTRSHNRVVPFDAKAVSPDARPWSVRTADGLTLRGWHHPGRSRRRLVVLVHGLWGSWNDMAGIGRDLHSRGYDVLLFDLRGHGESDPSRVFMGRRERGDLRAVLRWAEGEGFSPDRIGWLGFSMGASTLLMEGATTADIRVAVVDSAFGNLPELLDDQLARHSHLPRWFNPGILGAARYAYGVRTDDLVPSRSAKAWGARPLMMIHGAADSTVPLVQAKRIAGAVGPSCEAFWLSGVEHTEAYRADPERYVAAVDAFFGRHLAR